MALHFLVSECTEVQEGEQVLLSGAEAKHAAVVRRLRVGEEVSVGDGRGVWLDGLADEVSPGRVAVRVTSRRVTPAATPRLILAQALAKGDRDELAVQAACELGADEIVPWQAARSVSRWDGPKREKGVQRWQTIVREASKQAHRSWVPDVAAPEGIDALSGRAATQRVLVLDPAATNRLTRLTTDERDVVLVVGPEGGVSPEERDLLVRAGAETVRLGDTVLRTSTAGPAAIAVLSTALGRW